MRYREFVRARLPLALSDVIVLEPQGVPSVTSFTRRTANPEISS